MSYANKKSMKDIRQAQVVRIDIIAGLYKRGYSYREIRQEVMSRLNLPSYSLRTVQKDITCMMAEWRETRMANIDDAVQLELERIDEIVKEAWAAWEKSKLDYEKVKAKQQGVPVKDGGDGGSGGIATVKMEQYKENVQSCGDPRYLDIIHKNLMERRKLLGLYSPEKKEVTGDLSFTNLLMETGMANE